MDSLPNNISETREKFGSVGLGKAEDRVFDVAIIGAGPAGIAASIYTVRKGLSVLVLTLDIGGQAARSGDIENYPGFTLITGGALSLKFREELKRFEGTGLWLKEGVRVQSIEGVEGKFSIKADGAGYLSKTVIVASGRTPRMLGVPGEKEFFGKGVATCATCDAPLYKGKDVVVVGGGNSALDATQALMRLAKNVVVVNIGDSLQGDKLMLDSVMEAANVKVLNNFKVTQILGYGVVSGVEAEDQKSKEKKQLVCSGVFVEIGWVPSVDFVPPEVLKNETNEIIVDEFGKTSFDGIWACGDVNNLWGEQIVIAAGEGSKVALSVAEHVFKLPHQATSNVHEG